MNWQFVRDEIHVESFHELSFDPSIDAIIVFKHSPRCSISLMAKDRLERKWEPEFDQNPVFLIDVLSSRAASNLVSEKYGIEHQSPQVLIIKEGKCIYTASHSAITFEEIRKQLNGN
jgi:bacillithiol system protein YtxJ